MAKERIAFTVADLGAAKAKLRHLPGILSYEETPGPGLSVTYDPDKVAAKLVVKVGKRPTSGPPPGH